MRDAFFSKIQTRVKEDLLRRRKKQNALKWKLLGKEIVNEKTLILFVYIWITEFVVKSVVKEF